MLADNEGSQEPNNNHRLKTTDNFKKGCTLI